MSSLFHSPAAAAFIAKQPVVGLFIVANLASLAQLTDALRPYYRDANAMPIQEPRAAMDLFLSQVASGLDLSDAVLDTLTRDYNAFSQALCLEMAQQFN